MPPIVSYISDFLMITASLGAACYCLVLSRRLSRLTSFDKGIGGAIAVLSAQVDDMKSALAEAKAGSDGAGHHLNDLVRQARDISGELELMIAACHDFAEEALHVQGGPTQDTDSPTLAAPPAAVPKDVTEDTLEEQTEEEFPTEAMPVFGTRRAASLPEPVFRHRAQAQA